MATTNPKTTGALARDFFYPPFTVLDGKTGWWQDRKRKWIDIGLRSDKGRKPTMESMRSAFAIKQSQMKNPSSAGSNPAWATTSIFDPVLTEIMYRWFAPAGGNVFDPFCGGSVRGIVAAKLGLHYTGLDIRKAQITENKRQASRILTAVDPQPSWKQGDACSKSLYRYYRQEADFLFSCPPYGDLEVYSNMKTDISTMPWDMFTGALTHCIKQSAARLRNNRFAVFVVSDIRGPDGSYRGLPDVVRNAFVSAGMSPYGELVLLNVMGTLPLRARGYFTHSRKIGRAHQNVLLFVKGCPKQANIELGKLICKDPFSNNTTA